MTAVWKTVAVARKEMHQIVRDRRTLSTGFNGFARGVFDDPALLANVDEKLKLVCHAEVNAIRQA